MASLAAGSNTTLTLGAWDSVTVEVPPGASCVVESPVGTRIAVVNSGSRSFGPYASGTQVKLSAEGMAIQYQSQDGQEIPYLDDGEQRTLQALVSDAGNVLALVGGKYTRQAAQRRFLPAPLLQQVSSGTAPPLTSATVGNTVLHYYAMSSFTAGQTLVAVFDALNLDPAAYGIEVSVILYSQDGTAGQMVFRGWVSALRDVAGISVKEVAFGPAIGNSFASGFSRRFVLDPCVAVETGTPIMVRVERMASDAADGYGSPANVVGIAVRALTLPTPITVQPAAGYNSWSATFPPVSGRAAVVYSRGATHDLSPADTTRGLFARYTTDGGATWSAESTVVDTAGVDESVTGRGVDASGNLLMWVRRNGLDAGRTFHVYRSTDGGATWSLLASPTFATNPLHIADIIVVPTVGLMALYHAGTYGSGSAVQSWGKVVSTDGGLTWTQTAVETGLLTAAWPTEITAAYCSATAGRIIAIGRNEVTTDTTSTKAHFQLTSTDYGATWTRAQGNITDTQQSTASLVYEAGTDTLYAYYYHRGYGSLRRRKATSAALAASPMAWGDSEALANGATGADAGNANVARLSSGQHLVTYYSGDATNCGIYAVQASA